MALIVALLGVGFCLAIGAALQTATGWTTAAIHAALMIMAWGVLLPAGAVVGRYFKVTPKQDYPAEVDNPFWWNWHRGLQYAGLLLASVALVLMLRETRDGFATWHGRLGTVVMIFGWGQVVSTWFRGDKGGPTGTGADPDDAATWRGDHYDMTRRRRLFEGWHKRAGWTLLILAGITILLGIELLGGPAWLFAVVGALQAGAVLGVVDGRLRRRWVDTYHALWGPDPRHPGNRDPVAPRSTGVLHLSAKRDEVAGV